MSRRGERSFSWDTEAEARIARIPSFVQGTVMKEIEAYAKENGMPRITGLVLDQVMERWSQAIKHQGY